MDESPARKGIGARQLLGMGLDVFMAIPDAEGFASAAGEWFDQTPGMLASEESEEVLRQDRVLFRGRPQA